MCRLKANLINLKQPKYLQTNMRLLKNNQGIFWVIMVGTIVILVSTLTWLIAMLVTSDFIDIFSTQATGPFTVSFGESIRNQGAYVVAVIDIGMIVWMAVSAFKKESQEFQL